MKKTLLFLGAAAMLFAACSKEEDPFLTLSSESEVTVAAAGGQATVSFSTNQDWTAQISDKTVATISPAAGQPGDASIKVTFLKNDNLDSRSAYLTITAGTETAKVTFTQLQKNAITTEGYYEVDYKAQDLELAISSNAEYTITPDVDWITVSQTKGMVDYTAVLSIAENRVQEEREGTVKITADGVEQEVTILQGAFEPVLYMEYDRTSFLQQGESITFTVIANVEYELEDPEYDWCTLTKDGDTYTATATANNSYNIRYAYFTAVTDEFTVWEDYDWDGEPDTEVPGYATMSIEQESLQSFDWFNDLPSQLVDAVDVSVEKNEYSMALSGNNLFVATGVSVNVINAQNGSYVKAIDLGTTVKTLASDNAGNVVVETGGGSGEVFEIRAYTAENFLAAGEYTTVYSGINEITGYGLTNVTVTGNVFEGEAVVNLVSAYGAADSITSMFPTCTYALQLNNGVVTDSVSFLVPAGTEIWRSNDIVVKFLTGNINGGVFYMGYGADYDLHYNAGIDYDGWQSVLSSGSEWAEGYNAMDMIEWQGHKYLAFIGQGFFPSWGMPSYLWIVNVDDPTNPEVLSQCAYYGPGCDLTYIYSNTEVVLDVVGEDLVAYVIDGEQGSIARAFYKYMPAAFE